MIHVKLNNFNTSAINIQQYFIDFYQSVPLEQIVCPHCRSRIIRYGTYKHSLKIHGTTNSIKIQRVCCTNTRCLHRHHALIPAILVPCCQLLFHDIQAIIHAYDTNQSYNTILSINPSLDKRWIKQIIHRFKKYCISSSIQFLMHPLFLEHYYTKYSKGFFISNRFSYSFCTLPT